jgi:hypothetical protein
VGVFASCQVVRRGGIAYSPTSSSRTCARPLEASADPRSPFGGRTSRWLRRSVCWCMSVSAQRRQVRANSGRSADRETRGEKRYAELLEEVRLADKLPFHAINAA